MCPFKKVPQQTRGWHSHPHLPPPRGSRDVPVSSCPRQAACPQIPGLLLLLPTCVLLVASSLCPFLPRQASFQASRTSSFSTQNRTSTARPCGERCSEK